MSQFRIEIRKGGKIVGSWRLGDEPLEIGIYDGNEKTLDLKLSDPRNTKGSSNKRSITDFDDFTLPLPENLDGMSMEISENDRETEEAERHFSRQRQSQYREQDQAFKVYSNKRISEEADGSWDSLSEGDDATLPLSKEEILRRSQNLKRTPSEHFDDSDYEYQVGSFDDFSLPAIIEPTFDGVPELQDELQNEADQIRSSLFSSLKEDSNFSIDPPSMESLPVVEAEYSDVFRSLLLDDYPAREDAQRASSLEDLESSEDISSDKKLHSLEVWSFDGDSWEMLGELPPGEQTTVFDLTVRHHRSGKMTVAGFSEVAVMLIDDIGQEHLYTPGLDDPIPNGGTILLRKDDEKSICIRPPT